MSNTKQDKVTLEEISKLSYEECLKQLELLVNSLEQGELGLEESLVVNEKATLYSKACHDKLEAAKGRIEVRPAEEL